VNVTLVDPGTSFLCECTGYGFLEFWNDHMVVVSLLVFFGLMVLAHGFSTLGGRSK
jgi:hypothetical protein